MSEKKTIQINPELFKMSGNKTRKAKPAKEIPKPVVSPSTLRHKLLNRIKEHKTNEIKDSIKVNTDVLTKNDDGYDKEEFDNAIEYMTELSRKQKAQSEKSKYDERMRKKREDIQNRTLKTYSYADYGGSGINVSLDLPPELQEPTPVSSSQFTPLANTETALKINYNIDKDVPYGCLRGGKKPSFKDWTRKNISYFNNEDELIVKNTNANKNIPAEPEQLHKFKQELPERYSKLEAIKQKIKDLEKGNVPSSLKPVITDKQLIHEEVPVEETKSEIVLSGGQSKKILKKTIRRKFTLGKSKITKSVSVLVKDNKTRKRVLEAQRELKKTSIPDIKKYLKQHGMIKVGSTAPHDVLRKMYESSILAGDISNINRDTLIHNFLNTDAS
jgi:hypothetical protein